MTDTTTTPLHWADIDTILLDMDGTLLDLHYDNYFWMTHLPQRYATLKNIPEAEARQSLHQHIRSIEGTLNWYCLDYWQDALDIDIGALKQEVSDRIQLRPYTQAFLAFLNAQGKTVTLVTNAHPLGLNLKLDETGMRDQLNHIVSSHQFQYPKEDQAFWRCLQEHLPFDRERTLFIDDNAAILASAQTYGIRHIWGIHQPDSTQPRTLTWQPSMYDFDEIIPQGDH